MRPGIGTKMAELSAGRTKERQLSAEMARCMSGGVLTCSAERAQRVQRSTPYLRMNVRINT